MTRINCGIPVQSLTNKHLLAETREIKRIPNCVAKGRFNMKGQPKTFTLNKGHVKYFYDKCLYLKNRYHELYQECIKRNFKVQDYSNSFDNVPIQYMNDYIPTENDRKIVMERINERLTGK
jgi:deoxyribonuclease (pyrimidine dimer)